MNSRNDRMYTWVGIYKMNLLLNEAYQTSANKVSAKLSFAAMTFRLLP